MASGNNYWSASGSISNFGEIISNSHLDIHQLLYTSTNIIIIFIVVVVVVAILYVIYYILYKSHISGACDNFP